jgi:ribosomal protein L11 methylase PrmA
MMGILESLESAINKLTWKPGESEWSSYYNNTNYSKEAFGHKSEIVREYLHLANTQTVWDLGANDGTFSRIAAENSSCTIAFDIDPIAVNKNYHQVKQEKNSGILPLLLDLTNPSAALGWANAERDNLFNRANADCILALALIHHLAISNNLPLAEISAFLAKLAPKLIIEFVPKSDSKVQVLLATREDIFTDYNVQGFEASFSQDWIIEQKSEVMGSDRSIYFLKRRA